MSIETFYALYAAVCGMFFVGDHPNYFPVLDFNQGAASDTTVGTGCLKKFNPWWWSILSIDQLARGQSIGATHDTGLCRHFQEFSAIEVNWTPTLSFHAFNLLKYLHCSYRSNKQQVDNA